MIYGRIGDVGKDVSRVVQGTVMLSPDDLDGGFALLDAVYEAGINTFDTACVYGGGNSQRVLGKWMSKRSLREKVVVMDKGCHHSNDRKRVTAYDLSADLHDSLVRLESDYVDIFTLHRDDESVEVGHIVQWFNTHLTDGKIRAFGASNWTHQRIAAANQYAAENSMTGFTVSSPQYSLAMCLDDPWPGGCVSISGDDDGEAREYYKAAQMPIITYSALGGGFLSGRYTRDNLDTFTDGDSKRCIRCFCCEENFARLDRAAELGKKYNASVVQIALAFLIRGELNCSPIMAAWTPEEAAQNAAAADIELTSEEVDYLVKG